MAAFLLPDQMTSSVPSITFGPSGVVLPAESDVLAGVLDDMNAAFGGGLNLNLETPQGQLASSQTAAIGDKNTQIAYLVNQFDPANASGRFQDALARIYFLTRKPAEPTVLQVSCAGLTGTVISVGAKVSDDAGNVYACTQGGTIPSTGSITLPFANLITGPIAVPGAVSIYQTISGWDSATLVSGVIGQVVESRSDFEYRRQQSVAVNASGSLSAIYANVFAVDGVIDVYAYDNPTGSAVSVGTTSYSVAAHSIYVAVVGGVAADVAKAIWKRKSCGCDYNGNTTVTVQDTSGYSAPYPSYSVKFNVPTNTAVKFAVQIQNNGSLPSDIITRVKNAIVSAFSGGDGGPRARIGSTILASRFYAPVALSATAVPVLSIKVGLSTATIDLVTMGIDQMPTVSASDITVTLV